MPDDSERTKTTHLSNDGRRLIRVTRWLDRQVSPPRWRSKNDHVKLKPNEIEYYRQRAASRRETGSDVLTSRAKGSMLRRAE
jgi:hypothetical protein